MSDKIKTIAELSKLLTRMRQAGHVVVHCHGVFDLVHPGHIRHLEAAKREGDVLVVTITADAHVNKGPGRPVFKQHLRAETLAALQCVDHVAINDAPTAIDTIRLLQPNVFVKGSDYAERDRDVTGNIAREEQAVLSVGGRIHFTNDVTFSSTHLLNTYFDALPPEADTYLRTFRKQYSADQVIGYLKSLSDLSVLVVGDAIIDEYHFCRPYGMASKSSSIAAQFLSADAYAGGSLAVANHLAGFCKSVQLATCLGELDSRESFVRSHLKQPVAAELFSRPDAPTVIKRRYVQPFLVAKLFEVSFYNDQALPPQVEARFVDYLSSAAPHYDLVVVADFGHGLMTPAVTEVLCDRSRFLAVNAQLNSINTGYNVITKYPRADYVCIDEEETRLACCDRYGPLECLMGDLAGRLQSRALTVTRGHKGSVTMDAKAGFFPVPVLSAEVVDTIGAGDAYLAVTSACVKGGVPPDLVGFIGNAVGAVAVQFVGNKRSVEPIPLFKFIHALLK